MNEIQVFAHERFGDLRMVMLNGEPWFVAADVCKSLELGNPTKALLRLDDDEKALISIQGISRGNDRTNIVNEPGLYVLVLSSRKKEAKDFKRWVTHEVVPAIRKHGAYLTPEKIQEILENPDEIIRLATLLKEERAKRLALQEENAVMAPKAEFCDTVLRSPNLIKVTTIAKDYGMSAVAFNELLRQLGVQYKLGGLWTLYAPYQDKGYAQYETCFRNDQAFRQLKWTEAGLRFLYEFLKSHRIIPLSEKRR